MPQHKQTRRKTLRSALAHKAAADKFIDSLAGMQAKLNAALDKLDADSELALDTDYVASCALPAPLLADAVYPAQNKSSMRRIWRSKLKHKKLADALIEALAGLESNFNAMLAKLDAEAGTLDDTDYVSSLAVAAISPDAASLGQHKASLRKTMIDAMAHKKLGNEIVDAVAATQAAFNAVLAKLDAATISGQCAALKVSAIDPDSM